MLKKYQTTELIDDLDGSPATATVTFSVGGAHYAIDLSDENASKFNEAIAPYVTNGRRVTSRKKARKSTSTPSARRKKTAQIRAWAIQKGYTASTQGRLSPTVITAYEAAHQNADTQ